MLIKLSNLVSKYKIQFKGILHVGAHEAEEMTTYDNYLPRSKVLWIEAIPEKVEYCKKNIKDIIIEQAVVSDVIETVQFNISNNGQSSSVFELGLHTIYHPDVYYIGSFVTETKLLKNIISKYSIEFNFLNLDIQGYELKALKGMEQYLENVEYIYTEVNSDYVYKDVNLVQELDDYLKNFNFQRVETLWTDYKWGDAFYIKMPK